MHPESCEGTKKLSLRDAVRDLSLLVVCSQGAAAKGKGKGGARGAGRRKEEDEDKELVSAAADNKDVQLVNTRLQVSRVYDSLHPSFHPARKQGCGNDGEQ